MCIATELLSFFALTLNSMYRISIGKPVHAPETIMDPLKTSIFEPRNFKIQNVLIIFKNKILLDLGFECGIELQIV